MKDLRLETQFYLRSKLRNANFCKINAKFNAKLCKIYAKINA